jgi:hypothetical protein
LGQPPSFALRLAAAAFRFDVTLPIREPMLISLPQCGHFMCPEYTYLFAMFHEENQSSPLPFF